MLTCGTHSLRCMCDRAARYRSAWRASVMRAEQHQPCGALSWRRRRTHGCRKQLRVSGCHKQLRRSQLVCAVSPMSTTRIGCGGQARAAAGAPAPCSVSAHVRQPLRQAAPAATHVSSRTHDLWMRERLIERWTHPPRNPNPTPRADPKQILPNLVRVLAAAQLYVQPSILIDTHRPQP